MLKHLHVDPGSWTIEEVDAAFRILDATGRALAEIPFGPRSPSNLGKEEAKRMAEKMVASGDRLAKAGTEAKPVPKS